MTQSSKSIRRLCLLAACLTITAYDAKSAKANDYENPSAPTQTTAFSGMTPDTYDGYPLFRQSQNSGTFHYAANGIDVQGSYNSWTREITYTVTENGNTVTRTDHTSHSGYRMIHGVKYDENLFVLSYRR